MALSVVSSLQSGREQRLGALCCFKDSGCVPPARGWVDARVLRTGPAFLEDALALPDSFVLPFPPLPSDRASASWPSPCLNLDSGVPSPKAARLTSCPLSPAPCAHLLSLPCQCVTAVPVTGCPATAPLCCHLPPLSGCPMGATHIPCCAHTQKHGQARTPSSGACCMSEGRKRFSHFAFRQSSPGCCWKHKVYPSGGPALSKTVLPV